MRIITTDYFTIHFSGVCSEFDQCTGTVVQPTICNEGELNCPGPVDANGCQGVEVCRPIDDACPYTHMCPESCGPNQKTCAGELDPNYPNGCHTLDTCVDVDPTAACETLCPASPCPEPEYHCGMYLDSNGCNAYRGSNMGCSAEGKF